MNQDVWARAVLLGLIATVGSVMAEPRLGKIGSYACYYGKGEIETLSRYDLVILETGNYSPEEIGKIRANGTRVLGYLSVGEILEDTPGTTWTRKNPKDPAVEPYYLDGDGDGKPDRNGEWGSVYVDPRSPVWQQRILDELAPDRLKTKGCDGLFLDTIDTVDAYPVVKYGMASLIKKIRKAYPQAPVMANRGFTILDDMAAHLDAILFEQFSVRWDDHPEGEPQLYSPGDLQWVDAVLKNIQTAGGGRLQVFALDYVKDPASEVAKKCIERATQHKMPWSLTVMSLDKLPMAGGPQAPSRGK